MEWKEIDPTLTTNFMRSLVGDIKARLAKFREDVVKAGVDPEDADGGASVALAITLASVEQAIVEDWHQQEGQSGADVALSAVRLGSDYGEQSFKMGRLGFIDWLDLYSKEGGMEMKYTPRGGLSSNSKGDPVMVRGPKEQQ